jgi:hypothetical protein
VGISASIKKYAVTLESMGVPDPVRLQFREALNEAIGGIVRESKTVEQAVAVLSLSSEQAELLRPLINAELRTLDLHNCARYRLTLGQTKQWVAAGRPQ